ncbi:MAG: hypothetical protein JO057_04000 [Chloroflexi bacterium]|nr:hypothetical protein [Chloroflexota bacterium]
MSGLLAVWMQVPSEFDEEFNAWYNTEHVPERIGVPGFLTARRYVVEGTPGRYMAHYDLADLSVLHSEPYASISRGPSAWTRRIGSKLAENIRNEYELVQSIGEAPAEPAPYALLVRIETAPEDDAELNAWYEQDHLGALQGVPGCYRARRFRATVGSPRYLAMYEFSNGEVSTSDAWRSAGASDWTLRMRPKWRNFAADLGKLILSQTGSASLPVAAS